MKGHAIEVALPDRVEHTPQVQHDPELAWVGPTASELAKVLVATIPSGYCKGCRCIRSANHLQEGDHR